MSEKRKPRKPAAEADAAEPSFEQALSSLEAVVRQLEDGKLPLEESLASFEEGVRLIALCSGRLERAQLRVRQLEERPEGPVEREADLENES